MFWKVSRTIHKVEWKHPRVPQQRPKWSLNSYIVKRERCTINTIHRSREKCLVPFPWETNSTCLYWPFRPSLLYALQFWTQRLAKFSECLSSCQKPGWNIPFEWPSISLCLLMLCLVTIVTIPSNKNNLIFRDFPGSSVVKTPCSQCGGHRFDPWSGN